MPLTNKQKAYIKKQKGKSASALAKELKANKDEIQAFLDSEQEPVTISPGRRRLFYGFMFAIPVLFFVLLETGLRMADYKGNLSLFLQPEVFDGKYMVVNTEFTARYFFRSTTLPSPPNDVFLAQKPENGYRVFVLGGSTANGYPYGYNATFSRVFRDALQDVAPDRHVEVINIATAAINTYTLYDQIDEVLAHKPDAILIYSGHNEYYGALGVGSTETFGAFPAFVRTYLKLQRYKTFLFFREMVISGAHGIRKLFGTADPEVSGTLMKRMVGRQHIPLDSHVYEMGRVQYQSNLNAIIKKFDRRDIPVFIGSLASNLKDHPPFISIETDDHPTADEVFRQAAELYAGGDYQQALERFNYAKDLDALKFRAPTSFNQIVRETAEKHRNVHYVPVEEAFLARSENGITGFDLMLEHLHPNYTGYHLMGRTYFEAFQRAGFPGINADLRRLASWDTYKERMHMTNFDKRVGDHRIKLLVNSWPFVDEPDPEGYPRNYRFTSVSDSLAFQVVNGTKRWDQAKVRLGEIFEVTGYPHLAIAEYRGLMREQVFNDSPFVFAARVYLEMNDFASAKPLLEHAYTIDASAFTTKMLGAIEVDAGNIVRGIGLLEESRAKSPNDAQMLFNLSGAYALNNQFDKADEILRQLERVNPNFPGAASWRAQLNAHLQRQRN